MLWKIVLAVVLVWVALAVIGALVKGLFWLFVLGAIAAGLYLLVKAVSGHDEKSGVTRR